MWILASLLFSLGLIAVGFYFLFETYRNWTRKIEESQCFWRKELEGKLDAKMIEMALAVQESLVIQRRNLELQMEENFRNCQDNDLSLAEKFGLSQNQIHQLPEVVRMEILEQLQARFVHLFKQHINTNEQFMCYYCQHWFPIDELDQQGKYSYCSQHGKMRSNHVHHSRDNHSDIRNAC